MEMKAHIVTKDIDDSIEFYHSKDLDDYLKRIHNLTIDWEDDDSEAYSLWDINDQCIGYVEVRTSDRRAGCGCHVDTLDMPELGVWICEEHGQVEV